MIYPDDTEYVISTKRIMERYLLVGRSPTSVSETPVTCPVDITLARDIPVGLKSNLSTVLHFTLFLNQFPSLCYCNVTEGKETLIIPFCYRSSFRHPSSDWSRQTRVQRLC